MSDVKAYLIGDKKYEQRPLVYGQVQQLIEVLGGTVIAPGVPVPALVYALGDKVPHLLAVVLVPEGERPRPRTLAERAQIAEELAFSIEPEQVFQVAEDFFTCNPIPSILEKLKGMRVKIQGSLSTLSPKSFASSPAATSGEEARSSGDAPPPMQPPT